MKSAGGQRGSFLVNRETPSGASSRGAVRRPIAAPLECPQADRRSRAQGQTESPRQDCSAPRNPDGRGRRAQARRAFHAPAEIPVRDAAFVHRPRSPGGDRRRSLRALRASRSSVCESRARTMWRKKPRPVAVRRRAQTRRWTPPEKIVVARRAGGTPFPEQRGQKGQSFLVLNSHTQRYRVKEPRKESPSAPRQRERTRICIAKEPQEKFPLVRPCPTRDRGVARGSLPGGPGGGK